MAGIWETAGFALRTAGTQDLFQLGFFIPSSMLIVLAPLFLNAFIYMVLARMIHFFIPDRRCFGISATKLSRIFVSLDIFAFLVQASSSSLMSSTDPKVSRIGINVCEFLSSLSKCTPSSSFADSSLTDMGGIGLQELFMLIFTGLAIQFQRKMNQLEAVEPISFRWRPLLYSLYAGLVLITVRIIFRLIEYSSGVDSGLVKVEAPFYVLEALPMFVAIGIFTIWHPGKVLVGPDSEFPKKDKKKIKEEKRRKKQEKKDEKQRKKQDKKRKKGKKSKETHSVDYSHANDDDSVQEVDLERQGIPLGAPRTGGQNTPARGPSVFSDTHTRAHTRGSGSDTVPLRHSLAVDDSHSRTHDPWQAPYPPSVRDRYD